MCGITAIIHVDDDNTTNIVGNTLNKTIDMPSSGTNVDTNLFTDLYESLFHLQHRGQDSFGICTFQSNCEPVITKSLGLINKVDYKSHNISNVNCIIGHIRYSTNNKNGVDKLSQIQPVHTFQKSNTTENLVNRQLYMCHNGHIEMTSQALSFCQEHNLPLEYTSDSEMFYTVFYELAKSFINDSEFHNKTFISYKSSISIIINEVYTLFPHGSYSIICVIEGIGILCFKDRFGIRPLSIGEKDNKILIASESIALSSQNYNNIRELLPGEAFFYCFDSKLRLWKDILHNTFNTIDIYSSDYDACFKNSTQQFYSKPTTISLKPCIFEWIYLARAESIIYNVPVYNMRLTMGELLARRVIEQVPDWHEYDYIIPVPDTSRPYALSIAKTLNIPYIEAIIKNRYIYRTFIMDTQEKRKSNLKCKLNIIPSLIAGKNIMIVDDSIVRGNTMNHIIELLRTTYVGKITVISASPPIINVNKYGLDIPTQEELASFNYSPEELANKYNVDHVVFQSMDNLYKSVQKYNKNITELELSIFRTFEKITPI